MVATGSRWYGDPVSGTTFNTEIGIAAPPERVWEVLTDFDSWSKWNRVLPVFELRGPLAEGTGIRLELELGPLGRRGVDAQLVTVRENEELAWKGGLPGVVSARHGFRLEAIERGTRLFHTETFNGALAPVLGLVARRTLMAGYRGLNRGLRRHCEES